ncbi:MAG: hypothetical protein EXR02_06085 [Rhodospirillales bacterium]|nr:hypothetical protein [Rhodospirillales bacterium]MSP80619.1 hypothetical protein [Rhodospirillales bacterium]
MSATAVALGVVLALAPATAQEKPPAGDSAAAQAFVNSVSYQPLPERAVVTVRPLDNSNANLKLKVSIEEALRAKGFGITKDSPLVLSFDTRDEVGAWSETGRRTILELRAEGGREGGEYAHAKVNVFDSASGGLLNEGRSGTSITTPSTYRIDVTVDDRTSGRRLWQGWAIANLAYGERNDLDRAMIPVIVQNLGRTTTRQPFNLQ